MNTEAAARRWASTWTMAWPRKDIEAIAGLYDANARYRSHPFREPVLGPEGARAYLRSAFADEDEISCWFGEPIVTGSRAAVEWWAVYRWEGKDWTIAGTSILRFSGEGLVLEHSDHWALAEGRKLPPGGWGR